MGTSALKPDVDPAGRCDRNRKVFRCGDRRRMRPPEAEARYEPESLKHTIATTDKQADRLAHEVRGLTEEEVTIAKG